MPRPALAPHRDLHRLFDTRAHPGRDLNGAGYIDDQGVLTTWHITDHPDQVLRLLHRHGRIVAAYGPRGQHAELGPGLYFSDRPRMWISRARSKWDFLAPLTDAQLATLCQALDRRITKEVYDGYITPSEGVQAQRTIAQAWNNPAARNVLVILCDQPFNVHFWKADFLRPLGLQPSPTPTMIEAQLVGVFAELTRAWPDPKLLRALRRDGVAGAFIPMGMGSDGQLVLWEPRAVIHARQVPYDA
jgi:hypothetical protein